MLPEHDIYWLADYLGKLNTTNAVVAFVVVVVAVTGRWQNRVTEQSCIQTKKLQENKAIKKRDYNVTVESTSK